MKYPIYCYRDVKVGFDFPHCDQNDQTAIRGFSFAVNNNNNLMNFAPKDYSLYKIGEYDTEKGTIKACTPVHICEATDLIGVDK